MLKKKVHDFSTLNKSLREQVVELAKKEELVFKNLEELARHSEEFEEENGRRSRKMLLGVDESSKAIWELQERLNKKEDELKRAKVKECDLIVQLDVAENEIKSLKYGSRMNPPKVKQVWVRKDLVGQMRKVGRDTKQFQYRIHKPILRNSMVTMRVTHPHSTCTWACRECQMSGRTRQSTKHGSQVSKRRTRRGPQVPSPCVRHTEFEDRLEYFRERDIVVERGIALEKLEDTPIPQVVETRG
ncbi:hypothetical protein LWI28_019090 [Acer negundo]|uniref:Uncharacterized protein n=1 Tax=Acer negundo TaxID=4023 RepID=A0AAD5NW49_ACENE|nr:hypothetical protein LWI28_019090 [Acer negundo]